MLSLILRLCALRAGFRCGLTVLAAAALTATLPGLAAAAPPPPPPGGPPGLELTPPPAPSTPPSDQLPAAPLDPTLGAPQPSRPVVQAFARLRGQRFTRPSARRIALRFACNRPFRATLRFRGGPARRRRSACANRRSAALSFTFGRSLARRVARRGQLRARLTLRAAPTAARTLTLTVTRKQVRVRAGARSAQTRAWDASQASMTCGDIYSANTNHLTLTWHSNDGGVYWIYWRVWMQTYWDDPEGSIRGWYWYSPAGFNAPSPLYPEASYGQPYRMNGLGIVDLQIPGSTFGGGGAVLSRPWSWDVPWRLGYNMYASAWAQLYAWVNGRWVSDFFQVPVYGSPTDAPGYCYNR